MVQRLFPVIFSGSRLHCSICKNEANPAFHTAFFVMDESHQALSQKTQTEILSAPVCLREHAIHHAVLWSQVMNDNLPTCDRAVDSAENDLEMLNIFSFPLLSFFQTCYLKTRYPFAMLI